MRAITLQSLIGSRLLMPVILYLAAIGYEKWRERESIIAIRGSLMVQSADWRTRAKWRKHVKAEHNV